MKTFIAFAFLIVGISAGPHPILGRLSRADLQNERIITGAIESAIEDLSQTIREAGLDPLDIQEQSLDYALPVPVLFNVEAFVKDLHCHGLSNIRINSMNFGIITTRLTFDIELPLIGCSIGGSSVNVVFFGTEYKSQASGLLAINKVRINGSVRVALGIISGISIRDLDINFSLGGIESDLNVIVANNEISNFLNSLLGERIPSTLDQYSSDINTLLEILVLQVADGIL